MSSLRPAKLTTGQPYAGNQLYAGQGVKRSCGKCAKFVPIGQLRQMKPWGCVCPACKK